MKKEVMVYTGVHIPVESKNRLSEMSEESGAPISEIIRRALKAYFKQIDEKGKQNERISSN